MREARANIRQELQDNLREVDGEIAGLQAARPIWRTALQLADDLLASGRSDINQIDLGLSLASLSSASWQSAERTGALALMEYRDVQALSRVYDAQDLYVAQQRRSSGAGRRRDGYRRHGATKAAPRADLEAFRHEVLALSATLSRRRPARRSSSAGRTRARSPTFSSNVSPSSRGAVMRSSLSAVLLSVLSCLRVCRPRRVRRALRPGFSTAR